jgi:hypothetical protein
MNEKFLHYIWRLQYFNKKELKTTSGDPVIILHPGTLNTDSGPDFLNAKIKIGNITWFGNIEIHIHSSDWRLHHHSDDTAYNNVILHVVYHHDQHARRDNGSLLPVLELKSRISEELLLKYNTFNSPNEEIPCSGHLSEVEDLYKLNMIERSLLERLQNKALLIKELLLKNNNDWQETVYQLLAKNFGFKINSEPFLKLSQKAPLKNLLKQRDSLFKIESILFGQAGLLEENYSDEYPRKLKREYDFQTKKFDLGYKKMEKCEWRFLRVRPANFPTMRIAEFASLLYYSPDFFTSIFDFRTYEEVKTPLKKIKMSNYWTDHYVFDVLSEGKKNEGPGEESIKNILINTVVPLLFCYGKLHDDQLMINRALSFLSEIPAEKNKIIKYWIEYGINPSNAFDSQGLLEMYQSFCLKRNCLKCEIGTRIFSTQKISH